MFSLLPKDTTFFELFEKASTNAHQGALQLLAMFEKYDSLGGFTQRVLEQSSAITDIEHVGDKLTHEIMERLNKTFITPFDREDIHELSSRLDDIIDLIDIAVNRMVLYKIEAPTQDARLLAQCLVQCTELVHDMVVMLRHPEKKMQDILQKGREIHKLESDADRIEQHALAALFENGNDAKYIIKWKDIYKELETATDRCEDVANVIEGIVLKNA